MPSAISVADAMRALDYLRPADGATAAAIAALLGVQAAESSPASRTAEEVSALEPDDQEDKAGGVARDGLAPDERVVPGPPLPSTLKEAQPEAVPWPVGELTIDAAASEEPEPYLPLRPLFVPRWTRGILSAAFATTRAGDQGALDAEALIDDLARGEVIHRPPYRPWPTLRRGVQILVDCGEGMMPFTPDQRYLVEQIRKIAGRDRAPAAVFVGCPGPGRDGTGAWEPPLPGTVVVLLTDLGIGRPMLSLDPADETQWLAFARRARRAGCPLVAFVPYPRSSWPRRLEKAMTIVEWDLTTTAAAVRARVGRAHDLDNL
jgi:hypothetical protein